jgi:hypothetical protein
LSRAEVFALLQEPKLSEARARCEARRGVARIRALVMLGVSQPL